MLIKMGLISKLTPHTVKKIVDYVAKGLPPIDAAMKINVTKNTYCKWIREAETLEAYYDLDKIDDNDVKGNWVVLEIDGNSKRIEKPKLKLQLLLQVRQAEVCYLESHLDVINEAGKLKKDWKASEFILKTRKKEIYGNNNINNVKISNAEGETFKTEITHLTPEEHLKDLRARLIGLPLGDQEVAEKYEEEE